MRDSSLQQHSPPVFHFHIDEEVFDISDARPTGRRLLSIIGKDPSTHYLVQILPRHDNAIIAPDEVVDLATTGVEKFIVVVKPQKAKVISVEDSREEIIASRLAQYRQTKELIASLPRNQNASSPSASDYRLMAYEDDEVIVP